MAGLSGTSFTGYPLPDVAAGINLKNQVAGESSFLAVPKTCRVKFSRRTCLEKNPQLDEISARGCQALQRCFSQRNEKEQSDKKSNLKKSDPKKRESDDATPEQENSELLTEAFENPESTPVHLPRQADDKSSIIRKSIAKNQQLSQTVKINMTSYVNLQESYWRTGEQRCNKAWKRSTRNAMLTSPFCQPQIPFV